MTIIDVFDINDNNHLQAYRHLCRLGYWPDKFIEDFEIKLGSKLEFTMGWQIFIADKMANKWVDYKLENGLKMMEPPAGFKPLLHPMPNHEGLTWSFNKKEEK